MASITREVSTSELAPLVDATRREEHDTASLGGAELDALLAPERKEQAPQAPAPAPASRPSAPGTRPAPPSGQGFAGVAVAPTHVPIARVPQQIAEPSVVIADARISQATPLLASDLFPQRPSVPEPPRSSPEGVPMGPGAVASEPDWASRTHLPVSRETVRTSRKTWAIVIASAGVSLAVVAVIAAVWLTRGGQSTSNAPPAGASGPGSAPPATAKPASSTTAAPSGTANVSPSASAIAANTPEAEARAALGRLREGIGVCVREVIGVLPGTSPAVPASASMLKGGAYKSHVRDFRSPVFSCAKYKETEPQRFQIQWQVTVPSGEGRGVAWLDDNGDGKADRALSFRAALVRKNEVDLGEIGFLTSVPQVMKPRP